MRIEEFKLHHVHNNLKNQEIVRTTKLKQANQSILEKVGVRVPNKDNKSFFSQCLVGDCYANHTLIGMRKLSTSNATKHIIHVHEATSAKDCRDKQENRAHV